MSTTNGNDLLFAARRLGSLVDEVIAIADEIEKAEEEKPDPLMCEDCEKELEAPAFCRDCSEEGAMAAVLEAEKHHEAPEDVLREWAAAEKAFGRLTPEVFAALERAADDIEAGWPQ